MPATPPDRQPASEPAGQPPPADEAADPRNPKQRIGDAQAEANRDTDPPA
jgi:hypothetical protein